MTQQWNLADLFEAVSDVAPDREAVIADDRRLTYRELDERSTRLAHHLAASGVQAGDRQVEGATAGITVNQGLFGHGSSVIAVR